MTRDTQRHVRSALFAAFLAVLVGKGLVGCAEVSDKPARYEIGLQFCEAPQKACDYVACCRTLAKSMGRDPETACANELCEATDAGAP